MATAISIPLVITDQYLRFAKFPKSNARIMLLSGGRLDTSDLGIKRYTPNSSILTSAVYGDVLEYSYEFKTDENGFRITYECSSANNTANNLVAITGDSFTEGQGSNSSWTQSIQKQLCDLGHDSINASIAGYGIEDMKYSLDYAYKKLGANKALVAIIPFDIYRLRVPMTSNDTCSMYQSLRCGDSITWWHHPKDLNDKDIISFAKSKYDFGILPTLLKPLKNKIKPILKRLIRGRSYGSERIQRSISAMDSIVSRYGAKNVSLIILPTKHDRDLLAETLEEKTRRNADLRVFLDSLNKEIFVKDLRDCPLDKRHFYQLDGHPNEEGQKQLGICASKQIKNTFLF